MERDTLKELFKKSSLRILKNVMPKTDVFEKEKALRKRQLCGVFFILLYVFVSIYQRVCSIKKSNKSSSYKVRLYFLSKCTIAVCGRTIMPYRNALDSKNTAMI